MDLGDVVLRAMACLRETKTMSVSDEPSRHRCPDFAPTGWVRAKGFVFGRVDRLVRSNANKLLAWHPDAVADYFGWKNASKDK